jgi:drug/metabolite transporter (DMT)-like permease
MGEEDVRAAGVSATPDTLCGVAVPRIGLLWMAVSAFMYATASLFARFSNNAATSWQVVFVRCCVQWFLAVCYAKIAHPKVDVWGQPGARLLLVARGGVGIWGLACFYYAVSKLPLSDATVIFFTNPIWTCAIAWLALGEKIGLPELASIVISMAGICFIAKPTFLFGLPPADGDSGGGGSHGGSRQAEGDGEGGRTFAIVIALLGAVAAAGANVLIRAMKTSVHYLASVHAFAVAGMILSPLAVLVFQGRPLLSDQSAWGWELLCGICGFLAQCFMSRGLQLEKAGPASLMRNVDLLFAFL